MGSIKHMCDVGGGQGYFLCQLLLRHPHLVGTVLERSSVIDRAGALWANRLGLSDRCNYLAGDMFVDVPGADGYTLKLILQDWDDGACVQILRNLHRRAVTPGGRLFIIEHIIPDTGTPDFAAMYDMHMMCWGAGRERTLQEYRSLLEASGWRFVAAWFPSNRVIGVIEGGLPS